MAIVIKNVTEAKNAKKGPLIRVEISPGRYVKMYQSDALKQGLIKEQKIKKPAGDKMQKPQADKTEAVEAQPEKKPVESVDFTEIDGIGKATDRKIKAQGIATFEALLTCDLGFLPSKAAEAVASWRLDRG